MTCCLLECTLARTWNWKERKTLFCPRVFRKALSYHTVCHVLFLHPFSCQTVHCSNPSILLCFAPGSYRSHPCRSFVLWSLEISSTKHSSSSHNYRSKNGHRKASVVHSVTRVPGTLPGESSHLWETSLPWPYRACFCHILVGWLVWASSGLQPLQTLPAFCKPEPKAPHAHS